MDLITSRMRGLLRQGTYMYADLIDETGSSV
jgi:hypothetical protein